MKRNKLLIAAVAVFSVAVIISVFLVIWFWGDRYGDFKDLKAEFAIPDLKAGGSPQGLASFHNVEYEVITEVTGEDGTVTQKTEKKKQDFFFISSYMPEVKGQKQASRVYVVGKDTGYVGYVTLKNTDGTPHTGHVGGIALNRDFLWISSQLEETDDNGKITETGTVFVAKRQDDKATLVEEIVKKAANCDNPEADNSITFSAHFDAQGNASFLYYYDADAGEGSGPDYKDRLYVGEFYRKGDKYGTADTHHLTTPVVEKDGKKTGGDVHKAFVYEYNVNSNYYSDNDLGVYTVTSSDSKDYKTKHGYPVPLIQNIFSVPNEVQGFARTTDGKLVLSVSYGLKNSKLLYYDWNKLADSKYDTTPSKLYQDIFTDENGEKKYYGYDGFYKEYTVGKKLPYTVNNLRVYFIDSTTLLRAYDVPCMSEGLCIMKSRGEERVYVLFESGAKQYKKFVRQVLTDVYSFIPEKRK